jgi:hypothetical protein
MMEKLSQKCMLSTAFKQSLNREELLLKKYENIASKIRDRDLKDIIKEFRENSYEHIKLMKDKMIKLNLRS